MGRWRYVPCGLLAFGSRRANRYAHRDFRVCVAFLAADFAAFQPLQYIHQRRGVSRRLFE